MTSGLLLTALSSGHVTDSLVWSKPALSGTAPLPRSLHSATTIKNKYAPVCLPACLPCLPTHLPCLSTRLSTVYLSLYPSLPVYLSHAPLSPQDVRVWGLGSSGDGRCKGGDSREGVEVHQHAGVSQPGYRGCRARCSAAPCLPARSPVAHLCVQRRCAGRRS